MKKGRVAIFAHFDKDGIVDDYVLQYLEGLREVSDKIIFSSDCDLNEKEIKKLSKLCDHVIAERHREYDFGSYKRAINFLQKENYNQLVNKTSENEF